MVGVGNDMGDVKSGKDRYSSKIDNYVNGKQAIGKTKQAYVLVKDTGIGIHSEMFPRLFTKFASKSFEGTGLGLFISKKIIEAHGGEIWARNNGKGIKGATFGFSLPLN